MASNEAVEAAKKFLEGDKPLKDIDLSITPEQEMAIERQLREQLKVEYHTLRKQKALNQAIGRMEVAAEIEKQMANVITMLVALDSGEV